jgi:spermidine/putrescine transport system permease protein
MKRGKLPVFMTGVVLALLYLPLVILVINSFNASKFGGSWGGFSLKWYQALFNHRELWLALRNSMIIAISATFSSTFIGSLAAFALYRYRSRWQKAHYGLIYTPLVIPDILMGMSLLLLFVLLNINLGLLTVFFAHTTFCLSYVVMIMVARLQNFDYALIEAAQDLGADSLTILRRVLIPALMPGFAAAALLAFTLSLDDFVITFFVAGQGATTLPIYIYGMIKFGATPVINALSTILLAVTFVTITLVHFFSNEE